MQTEILSKDYGKMVKKRVMVFIITNWLNPDTKETGHKTKKMAKVISIMKMATTMWGLGRKTPNGEMGSIILQMEIVMMGNGRKISGMGREL